MLPRAIADESFSFNSTYLYGVKEEPPRWLTCVSRVDEDLGEALGREFVARNFSATTRQDAVEMIEIVQQVMRQRIEQLDWMSEATKKRALEKLATMRNKVGYPERWRDYSSVVIDRGDYFGNRVRAVAFEESRLLARIGKPVDPDEWQMTPQTVNAYYDWFRNDMNFPAGILQPPLFDLSIDAAPSWGNTGMTIGHELIHGFDDTGRHFDARGNLVDWWTPADAAEFNQRSQCLVDQYATYTFVDDIKVNSKMTLGEDIADLAGTILAYLGWKVATEGQALESRDGLTPDQRFFVGGAQWACGHETEERSRVLARVSAHSPLRHRVNGVMVNMPEFARAFQCREGDALYRKPETSAASGEAVLRSGASAGLRTPAGPGSWGHAPAARARGRCGMTTGHVLDALKRHPFARELHEAHLDQLVRLARVVHFRKDEILFREGEQNSNFYLIVEGPVALEVTLPRRMLQVQRLGAGDGLGWSPHSLAAASTSRRARSMTSRRWRSRVRKCSRPARRTRVRVRLHDEAARRGVQAHAGHPHAAAGHAFTVARQAGV